MDVKTSKEKRRKNIKTVELSAQKHRKYKIHAAKNGITMREFVEEAVDNFLAKK